MAKRSVKKEKAPEPAIAAEAVTHSHPVEVVPTMESLLPTADFTALDLELYRKKKGEVLDALQLRAILDLQSDPQLRRTILARQGAAYLSALDQMARLERGQSTQNISIATFDAQVQEQMKKVQELQALRDKLQQEENDAKKVGTQTEEGSGKQAGVE